LNGVKGCDVEKSLFIREPLNKLSARYPRKGSGRPPYLNFHHFLEKHELSHVIFLEINAHLQQQGVKLFKGEHC